MCSRFTPGDLDKIRDHLGTYTKVLPMAHGLTFYEGDLSLTILEDSAQFTSVATMLKRAQNMESLLNISATSKLDLCSVSQPIAPLVLYQIYAGYDGSRLLCTTKGRADLRLFIVEHLFPRLRQRTDIWKDDTEDSDTDHERILEAFTYLHAVYVWLGHLPEYRWTLRCISLPTMAYLLEDDPEILFWDHRDNVFQNVPWARELDLRCTLHEFQHHAGAIWHIGHCKAL
jgi:hypothetical protein